MAWVWLVTCNSRGMILLISSSAKAPEFAKGLQEATAEAAEAATTLREAATKLRAREYTAVVVDQSLLDSEPEESETVLLHTGAAVPVYVNFAISGMPRVVRELHVALSRHKREHRVAREAAQKEICNQLKDTVTALLVSCEMALQLPEIPAAAEARMRNVHELAGQLRGKLGMTAG
jgi:hypothetical protein